MIHFDQGHRAFDLVEQRIDHVANSATAHHDELLSLQILQANLLLLRQRRGFATHPPQTIFQYGQVLQVFAFLGIRKNGEIAFARLHQQAQLRVRVIMHLDGHFGVQVTIGLHHHRKQQMRHRGDAEHANTALLAHRPLPCVVQQAFIHLQHPLRIPEKNHARGCQLKGAGGARHELDAGNGFQIRNGLTECRLAHVQLTGRFDHGATFDGADKGLQMPRVKVIHLNQRMNHKNRFVAWVESY